MTLIVQNKPSYFVIIVRVPKDRVNDNKGAYIMTQKEQLIIALLNAIISDIWIKQDEDLPDVPPFSERIYQKMRRLYKEMGWNYDPTVMER